MWDKESVVETLVKQGHSVDCADDDPTAISMAARGDYDIVIVAEGDRSGDALRLVSQLRSQAQTRHGPILLLVPEGSEDRLAKGLELGINDYLVRPVEQDELIARSWTQIRRKRYEERLRETYVVSVNAAVTDPLTGLYNRRYLESHFERMSDRLKEEGKPISLLMLDIDHFKQVNDTYGHDAGDQVLKEVAQRIVSNLRGFDTAVRFGGEEFVILLPDSPLSTAVGGAERLCESMSSASVLVTNNGEAISITASLGAATMMAGEETLEELLRRADAAMYQAKESGRNRVISSIGNAENEAPQQSAVG